MNLTLVRFERGSAGVFGKLLDDKGIVMAYTLEHSYLIDNVWAPKVPSGRYICEMGAHKLGGGEWLDTAEVLNVPGHTGILFHAGNSEAESSGCIILGTNISGKELLQSRIALNSFLFAQRDVSEFVLTVQEDYYE